MVNVHGPVRFSLGVMHIPNQVTGRKPDYHRAVLDIARRRRREPALLLGDTNSGQIGLDEQSPVFNAATDRWFRDLAQIGWNDAFRLHRGRVREYTWYSPNKGNGFRLDQAFVNRHLRDRLIGVRHQWGRQPPFPSRREALSDHAALIVDLSL